MSKEHALVFIRRTPITDAILIDSNVPEDDYPEYDPDATYSTGAEVMVLADHGVYVSTADNNTGNDPLTAKDKWARRESTNRWRVFDESLSTLTSQSGSITYQLRPPKAIGGLAILGVVNAVAAQVVIDHPEYGEVYNATHNLTPLVSASSWWQWLFGDRVLRTQSLFLDVPTYPGADIYITITGGADLGVGMITLGQQRRFGYGVRYGARAGITTYSTVTRDIDGRASIKKRPFARRSSLDLALPNDEIDSLYQYLGEIESEPVLMVASRQYETFTGFGLVKNFEIVIPGPSVSDCSIEFDGMT